MSLAFTLVLAASVSLGATTPQPIATQSCAGLLQLALPNASITSAQVAGAGAFSTSSAFPDLPAFCRVAATLRPSSDSEIKIEVWLPIAGWNGKFLAMGSGGWGGAIDYKGSATHSDGATPPAQPTMVTRVRVAPLCWGIRKSSSILPTALNTK